MRLIRAHIENFGKLNDFDISFTDGLNIVVDDNGWGKSTLLAFIRVMLFGFENERGRTELGNERRRFTPWQGGTYGGTLVFEQNGKRYRVERIFEKGHDSFELYDDNTNLIVNDYSDNLGEELFDIDRDSFSKTVFVGQQACATEATSQINAKIGNIAKDNADMSSFDNATEALKKERNRLTGQRETGELSKLRKTIGQKEAFVNGKPGLESAYDNNNEEINDCRKKMGEQENIIRDCDNKLEKAAKQTELIADKKEYEGLLEEKESSRKKFEDAQKHFPRGIPSIEEVDAIVKVNNNINGLSQVETETALTDEEVEEYQELQNHFPEGVPADSLFLEMQEAIYKIGKLREEKQLGVLSDDEYQDYIRLERLFAQGVPRKETVDELIGEWSQQEQDEKKAVGLQTKYDALKNRLWIAATRNQAAAEKEAKSEYDATKKRALIWIIAGLALAFLFLLFYLLKPMYWLLFFVVIGTCLVCYGYYWKMPDASMLEDVEYEGKDYLNAPELLELKNDIQTAEKQISELEDSRNTFFAEYGLFPEEDNVYAFLYGLGQDVSLYNELSERVHKQDGFQNELAEKTKPVFAFFNQYGIDTNLGDLNQDFYRLKNMAIRYNALQATSKKQQKNQKDLDQEKEQLETFVTKYGLRPDTEEPIDLTKLRDNIIALQNAKKEFDSRTSVLKQFEEEHDLQAFNMLDDIEEFDLESIKNKKNSANDKYAALADDLKDLEDDEEKLASNLRDIADAEQELVALREKEQSLSWRQSIINKTTGYLEDAKNSFLAHYLAPMQNAFDRYFVLLSGEETDVYELDAELNISKRANGKLRNVDLLSEGYKDLVGLCRRMAMIDAMYEEEKPFLIFDDPFVNFDDKKLDCGIGFLKKISEKYQVIYTTCHTSRTV